MELIKFHQIKTNDLVYVVKGARSKNEAFHFVRDYKKMAHIRMALSHYVITGKIVETDNQYELYTQNLDKINGEPCYVIARVNIELNPKKIYKE